MLCFLARLLLSVLVCFELLKRARFSVRSNVFSTGRHTTTIAMLCSTVPTIYHNIGACPRNRWVPTNRPMLTAIVMVPKQSVAKSSQRSRRESLISRAKFRGKKKTSHKHCTVNKNLQTRSDEMFKPQQMLYGVHSNPIWQVPGISDLAVSSTAL
jgi:hypothetical protein